MFASTLNIVLGSFVIAFSIVTLAVLSVIRMFKSAINNVGRKAGRLFN